MTIRMVKSSQFGKIAEQGRKYFSGSLNEQAENLRAGWQKNLKNLSEHALLLNRDFRVMLYISTVRGLYTFCPILHCGLYYRAVRTTDNLCTKKGNSSIFWPKIRGL